MSADGIVQAQDDAQGSHEDQPWYNDEWLDSLDPISYAGAIQHEFESNGKKIGAAYGSIVYNNSKIDKQLAQIQQSRLDNRLSSPSDAASELTVAQYQAAKAQVTQTEIRQTASDLKTYTDGAVATAKITVDTAMIIQGGMALPCALRGGAKKPPRRPLLRRLVLRRERRQRVKPSQSWRARVDAEGARRRGGGSLDRRRYSLAERSSRLSRLGLSCQETLIGVVEVSPEGARVTAGTYASSTNHLTLARTNLGRVQAGQQRFGFMMMGEDVIVGPSSTGFVPKVGDIPAIRQALQQQGYLTPGAKIVIEGYAGGPDRSTTSRRAN